MWISVNFLCYHKTFSTMRFFVDSDSDECAAEQHNCNGMEAEKGQLLPF